ncbi:uncharacterized protein GGS25DRAFT_506471 [Hypoxylon fragiforme]|uniref:uncharacterized protein n=1 Tax=Hypoxylon fragiforme TaxID=63214 RepID=UPI0020C66F06|nr:uncharacterized protein GGS25DRAFT_506471 [Hypoxylon fragiforme]KAI2603989.1 hypothetical protein GGS25DRAFT_506471 [Hypoxylon fragiforme]
MHASSLAGLTFNTLIQPFLLRHCVLSFLFNLSVALNEFRKPTAPSWQVPRDGRGGQPTDPTASARASRFAWDPIYRPVSTCSYAR